jgi:hypothetical protein
MPKKSSKQQMASTPKYSESIFFAAGARNTGFDHVLQRFEARSHMLREAIEREIMRRERQPRGK